MPRCLIVPLPVSPIEHLTATFRDHLHLPDPGPLYTLMGAVAANMIEGDPVWLMFIGAPSCGKSALLNTLLDLPQMIEGADLSGEAAFLSGTSQREWAKDATGGLLKQVGRHGGVILNDFTSVLSNPLDKINKIMSIFREAFGGRYTRHIGAEGGRQIHWAGKLALFAGVTGKIDQHHQISAELGERWVYYRFDGELNDAFQEVMMALADEKDEWRQILCAAVRQFFEGLDLKFGANAPRRKFTDFERIRIYNLASMAARCRSGVARDSYTKEIVGARETELAIRLSKILAQLLIGLDIIGVPEQTQWRLLTKVAMDSMPKLRRILIEATGSKDMTVDEARGLMGCSLSVAKRVVEDLELHNIVYRINQRVHLTPWMEKKYRPFVIPAATLLSM